MPRIPKRENLNRNHYNESQRAMVGAKLKALFEEQAKQRQQAAEVGRLILKLQENSSDEDNSNLEIQWFLELIDKSGITQSTAYNWWSAFCKDANLKLTPKQADMATRLYFFRWLDEQKAKDDTEKARKEEEKNAEKARKEQEKALAKRNEAFAAMLESLRNSCVTVYGKTGY